MTTGRWRVGTKLGRTLYLDDQCVGMLDTPELAAKVVVAMESEARCAERLAAVEKQRDDLALVAMGRASAQSFYAEVEGRKAAEARCAELAKRCEALDDTCAAAQHARDAAQTRCAELESELAELRERVAKADRLLHGAPIDRLPLRVIAALEVLRGE